MNVNYYLINLDSSTDRLEQADSMLNNLGVDYQRISAVDGRNLDLSTLTYYDQDKALHYLARTLNGGEIGCYLSHVNAVKAFLASDADYAVVLEDDAHASQDFTKNVTQALEYIEKNDIDCYVINIGATKATIKSKVTDLLANHALYHSHYFPMTTTGIVWTRAGAEEFFKTTSEKIYCPIDNFLRSWLTQNNKGYSIYPPITAPNGEPSVIDKKNTTRKKQKRRMLYGLLKQKRLNTYRLIALKYKYGKK